MDEIDQVVDNLFSQYIKPGSTVAPGKPMVPSAQPEQPPAPPAAEQPPDELIIEVSPSPAVEAPVAPAPQPPAPQPAPTTPTPVRKAAAKAAPVAKASPKKKKRAKADKGIKEVKMETAKMLRYLSMAIKSDNWWHKLYYSHKFVRKSMYIAQVITKRKK